MGTGRCGTRSLAALLNRQPDSQVTHEEYPLLMWRSPQRESLVQRLERMLAGRQASVVGDVASFYLPYAAAAIDFDPEIRIVCLQRPRAEVIHSFCQWIDKVHPLPTNHWAKRPAPGWYHEPIWTQIFPQYETTDRLKGIGRYWDEYFEQAESLQKEFPENVRIFDWLPALSTTAGQSELLSFCGFPADKHVVTLEIHENKGESAPIRKAAASDSPNLKDPRRCIVLVPFSQSISAPCQYTLQKLEARGYSVRRVKQYAPLDQVRSELATQALVKGFVETLWVDSNAEIDATEIDRIRARNVPIACLTPSDEPVLSDISLLHIRREVYERVQWELELPVESGANNLQTVRYFQPLPHEGYTHEPANDGFALLLDRARHCDFAVNIDRIKKPPRPALDLTPRPVQPASTPSTTATTPCPRERCAILVPVADRIEAACDRSLRELESRGYRVTRSYGYKQIDLGRSQMASDALAAGCEETLWIDADTAFHPDMVERLRSHAVPVVCGIYPKKNKRELAIHALPGTEQIQFGVGGGLLEIMYAPTGFLLVRRNVYEQIRTQLNLRLCWADTGRTLYPFYAPLIRTDGDSHWYLAEDFAFCERARQCGFKIMADTSIRLLHIGTYEYGWEDAGRETTRFAKYNFRLTDPKKPKQ